MPDEIRADEFTRIADELHDVVTHALSAMTVQAAGARRLVLTRPGSARAAFTAIETAGLEALDELRRLQAAACGRHDTDVVSDRLAVMVIEAGGARRGLDRDPGRALDAATRIERTGRDALTEMRDLLGVYGATEQPPALAPQPTLAGVGGLIARARAAGLSASIEVRGEPRELPAGLDLTAYRIVEEGLNRAVGHAPATVVVDWSAAGALTLEVRDHGLSDTRTLPSGDAIRERVRLYGGELQTGPADGGGRRVRATLPTASRELNPA
jgi:signal transduction histidine kinase